MTIDNISSLPSRKWQTLLLFAISFVLSCFCFYYSLVLPSSDLFLGSLTGAPFTLSLFAFLPPSHFFFSSFFFLTPTLFSFFFNWWQDDCQNSFVNSDKWFSWIGKILYFFSSSLKKKKKGWCKHSLSKYWKNAALKESK